MLAYYGPGGQNNMSVSLAKSMTTQHVVTWSIDIFDAVSPVDAAVQALMSIIREGSTAHVFSVKTLVGAGRGTSVDVDLDEQECANCGEPIYCDDNGAGVEIWTHDFGSTVCDDYPLGSVEDGPTASPVINAL